jgi:hypothetical protein
MITGPIIALYYALQAVFPYAFSLAIVGSIVCLNGCVGVLFYRQYRLEKRIK